MRNSLATYIAGGIAAAEGFANLMGNRGTSGRRTASSARSGRTSGS